MHVVRLLAPRLANEDHTKDVDFSPSGIRRRWEAGHADTRRVIEQAPWEGEFDPLEGVILHHPPDDMQPAQIAPRRVAQVKPAIRSRNAV